MSSSERVVPSSCEEKKSLDDFMTEESKIKEQGEFHGHVPLIFAPAEYSMNIRKYAADRNVDLKGKVVMITGAASLFGSTVCKYYASEGCLLVIVDNYSLEESKRICLEEGMEEHQLLVVEADVTCLEELKEMNLPLKAIEHFGKLDTLVHNTEIDDDEEDDEIDYELEYPTENVIFLTKQALPYLMKTKGNILKMTTILGDRPRAKFTEYNVSDGGGDIITECGSLELSTEQVKIVPGNLVCAFYSLNEEHSGASGSEGASGSKDSSVASGALGSEGSSVASGASGSEGSSVASGASGSEGSSVASGASGSEGSSVASGASGSKDSSVASGDLGSEDPSGASGFQDPSDVSGASGSENAE